MSRYLCTGATTAVGRALVHRLLESDETERVIAVGGEEGRSDGGSDGRLTYLHVDLRRERSIRELMFGPVKAENITTIVDMATHRDPSSTGRRAHALNVDETRHLLHLAERIETVTRFVYRSFGCVYRISNDLPSLIDEDHPLRIGPRTPQYVLDRVEADLAVCSRMGMSPIRIAVLRCAECLAPETGSQLWDYLQGAVCFRPLGFDPMLNVISEDDLAQALALAARSSAEGVFTIPGLDTLPLSRVIERFDCREVAVPGPLMRPLYALRTAALGSDFRYGLARSRLHFGGVLDGARAREALGYVPGHAIRWPLSLDRIGRRAQRLNPKSLRGKFASLVGTDSAEE